MYLRKRALPGGVPLNNSSLTAIGAGALVPAYDRSQLAPGVVHIGVGGFHRSHQAVYLDDVASHEPEWGVVGVNLRSDTMKRALYPQDCLYTVLERDATEDRARVVGSLTRNLYAPDDPEAVLAALAAPETRLVTLTVTGNGYGFDQAAGRLATDDADIARDLTHPRSPRTPIGYLAEGLRRRRAAGLAPFTVMSCDNVFSNGQVTRRAVVSFAEHLDPSLAAWIDAEAAFPSTVVDRITPQTTPDARRLLAEQFGIRDRWPVVSEGYRQWTIEDAFCNGRPPLELAGAQFVDDVGDYELIKKRLLNGSHCAMGYLGYLAGHRTTDEAMADPRMAGFVESLMDDEVTPLVPEAPGIDLDEYKATLLERFANPKIGDQLQRLCGRGSTKMHAYFLPVLRDALEQGRPHDRLTLALAAWFVYLRGVDFEGTPIKIIDPRLDEIQPLARADDPRALLSEGSTFGDLADNQSFVRELGAAIRALETEGPAARIDAVAGETTLSAA
jgi:fructuronate reductase/mannitol 2-dehydrogenase